MGDDKFAPFVMPAFPGVATGLSLSGTCDFRVVTGGPPQERDYPPIPEPGLYWARIEGADRWEPVEVYETGHRRVGSIGIETCCMVTEWGPKLEPPR